ncbi:MAG: 2-oxoacid:acceptor oxidoreductase family protein [Acholeplasmataceae bacterium]
MTRTIRIAGFGGQGVMLTGQLLAYAATKQGLYTIWVPTYGPETRGGTANCAVTISDQPIFSPVFKDSDDLLVFNLPSYQKFKDRIRDDGNLFYNASLIDEEVRSANAHVFGIPMSEEAIRLGKPQVANMVMLGAYLKRVGLFQDEVVLDALMKLLGTKKKDMLEINRSALEKGRTFIDA